MTWPITWPASVDQTNLDPNIKLLCEVYASACMTALTLHRVGGNPVTIMPAPRHRLSGRWSWGTTFDGEYPLGTFYPSATALLGSLGLWEVEAIDLPGPVAAVHEVTINGAVLDPAAYRIENGRYLVRLDGDTWPRCEASANFTVTYLNSHPVDQMGSIAAGVMAAEWLKLLNSDKKCRLSATATSINRQGITMELTRGMFPDGVTGIPEIDAYLMLFNPFGLKVAPRVYSPDLPEHRQVWP